MTTLPQPYPQPSMFPAGYFAAGYFARGMVRGDVVKGVLLVEIPHPEPYPFELPNPTGRLAVPHE